jgi:capsular polysaccharide biosynthesis protein
VYELSRGSILLVSEARGEFLTAERVRLELAELGWPAIHVTAQSSDVSPEELSRSGAVALDSHPRSAAFPSRQLQVDLKQAEQEMGVNLRRLWQADFRFWREGLPESTMAKIALGYLGAWKSILQGRSVTCLWGEDGGHLSKQTAFLIARNRSIPTWFLELCPIPNRLMAIDNPFTWPDSVEFHSTDPTSEERDMADRFLAEFRAGRIEFANPRDLSFRPARVLRFSRLLVDRYLRRGPGSEMLYPWTFAKLYLRQRVASATTKRRRSSTGRYPFIFYPIHSAHDAQLTIRATQWENQLALIEHLAVSLPFGYELAIKEHPFEVGGLPVRGFRSLLRRRPEIRLLDPGLPAQEILSHCAALATVNSTTGFEALFLRKPVVTFGHSRYRGLSLTRDIHDPFETPQALLEAVNGEGPDDGELVRLLAFLYRRSYRGRPVALDASSANVRQHAKILADLAAKSEASSAITKGSA